MARYRLLDHTADLGFECLAKTRETLYAAAALALCDIMARTGGLSATAVRAVEARGQDDVALMRGFLDEVLFAFEKDGFLSKEAVVTFAGDVVRGQLRGQIVDLATHPIERVVKAVTYHGLEIEKTRGGYRARVILDL